MKRKLCELGIIILFYLLQVSLCRVIAIGGVAPNLMIILPVLFGYFNGSKEGMYVGFCSGIMYDLFFTDLLGFTALMFTLIGFFSGMLSNRYEEGNFVIPIFLTAGGVLFYEFFVFIGNFLLQNRLILPFFMTRVILPEIVYTVIAMLVLYKPLQLLNKVFDSRKRKVKDIDETIL